MQVTQARPPESRRSSLAIAAAALILLLPLLIGLTSLLSSRADIGTGVAPASPPPPPATAFVQRAGTRLYRNGAPFRFVGYNSYVMLGCGRPSERLGARQQDAFFAALRPGSVVRLWLFPGTVLSDADRVLQTARRHGQLVVLTLTDHHGGCGDTDKDDAWYASGFRGAYLDWLRTVVPRYRDDPTVAMWELANEPTSDNASVMRTFFDVAGGVIRELDKNHLVSSGTLAAYANGGASGYLYVSASPNIDVVSLHEYEEQPTVSAHFGTALETARALDKPLLVGETGIKAAPPHTRTTDGARCLSFEERAEMAAAKTKAYLQEPVVAGVLWWAYSMDAHTDCSLGSFPSDPLVATLRDIDVAVS